MNDSSDLRKLNCIVCSVELENWGYVYPNKKVVHPIDGTVFRAYGNYGSTVFDPMDASYLDVVICDRCLTDRMDRAYKGVNEEYRAELDANQVEMEKDLLEHWELKDD